MTGIHQRTEYLLEQTSDNIELILLYWQQYDGINIPEEVAQSIREKATSPQSIYREKRRIYQVRRNDIKGQLEKWGDQHTREHH